MNLNVTEEGQWYRVTILKKEHWAPATFFPQLESLLAGIGNALSKNEGMRILFDLMALDTIDSSLISIVVQTFRMSGVNQVNVLVSNPDVFSRLALLGLDRLAEIFYSEEAWRQKHIHPQL
jgi:anti-anti-sigma regulatory factor